MATFGTRLKELRNEAGLKQHGCRGSIHNEN